MTAMLLGLMAAAAGAAACSGSVEGAGGAAASTTTGAGTTGAGGSTSTGSAGGTGGATTSPCVPPHPEPCGAIILCSCADGTQQTGGCSNGFSCPEACCMHGGAN